MNINLFWEKLGVSKGLILETEKLEINFMEINKLCSLYEKNHKQFFQEVLKKEECELWFFYLYSFMACKTYDKYQERGIGEKIYWDTFLDIKYWCENYEKEYGKKGLWEYEWICNHIDMNLFRLGRLQFQEMELEEELKGNGIIIEKGTKVLNIHIPQGESLNWKKCKESINMAEGFWKDKRIYVCHSWLLYPGIAELLGENSNIRRFAKHFNVIQTDFQEREAEWRIFGKVNRVITQYPENTILQKRAKNYLLSGKVLGSSWGVLEKQ